MIKIFKYHIPESVFLFLIIEAFIFLVSVYIGAMLRFIESGYLTNYFNVNLLQKSIIFATVMTSSMLLFNSYYYWEWSGGIQHILPRLSTFMTLGIVVMALTFYLFPASFLRRGVFPIEYFTSVTFVYFLSLINFRWPKKDGLKRQVLVLGTGSRAAKIYSFYKNSSVSKRLNIIGYLPFNGTQHFVDHAVILRNQGCLSQIAKLYNIGEIIVAIRNRRGELPVEELLACRMMGIKITDLSAFLEREAGQLQVETLSKSWMIYSEGFRNGINRYINKRIFDLIISGLLLIMTLPVMVLAVILIFIESGSPVIYRQERVGQDGRVFTIYKFRSMRLDAENGGTPIWATQNDNRVTSIGRILRKLRIDELPQILNVIKGNMSLVGPRPERPFFVEELARDIAYYKYRHSVKPGITGWAQVRYSYGSSVEDSIEKLQYDLYYVKNHGLFFDFMILLTTVHVVLLGKGAR